MPFFFFFFFFLENVTETPFSQVFNADVNNVVHKTKPEDHWSCIAHLIAEDMLKSAVIEEKKYKNIECK